MIRRFYIDNLKSLVECGGTDPTANEQASWVNADAVDPLRIDMPRFNAFKQALHTTAHHEGLSRLPCPMTERREQICPY